MRTFIIIVATIVFAVAIAGAGGLGYVLWFKQDKSTRGYSRGARAVITYPPSVPFEDRFEKDQLLVLNPTQKFDVASSELGFSVIERYPMHGLGLELYRMKVPTGMTVPKARRQLAKRFPRATIDASHHFETQAIPVRKKKVPRALIGWERGTSNCGAGLHLGMIDGPIDLKHEALKGRKIKYQSFHESGRRAGPEEHGTSIAAMLVGRKKWGGLLPGARLTAANMFEETKSGLVVGSANAMLKAINWMALERVHVVNLSIAGANNKVLKTVLKRAQQKGVIVVAAAGNGGSDASPYYPAAYRNVFAVTAFGKNKKPYKEANRGSYIDFAAPGVNVFTAVPGGSRLQSGTSFATPFVSVLVALQTASGQTNPKTLRRILRRGAVDLGSRGKDKVFGWGMINMQPNCQ